jgi:glyoxylase-like metal-dependent hydrolase (beta-lactamase superfamily II)
VGDVNVYLIDDDPLTLVDSGPDTEESRAAIDAAFAARGRAVEDLERIVLTHQHIDHAGLAAWLRDRSGAEVYIFDEFVPHLEHYIRFMEQDDAFAVDMMVEHGIERGRAEELRAITKTTHKLGLDLKGAKGLREGDTVDFADRTWQVLHRPGHSPSDLVFFDEQSHDLIAGDHLLSKISSNPIAHMALDGSNTRPPALANYVASLAATRAMDVGTVYGGHGPPASSHRELIDERIRLQDRRADKIERVLSDGPLTAHGIAHKLWGDIAVKQAYLTLSEVLGHLDLLVADGRVIEIPGEPVQFTLP